MRRFIVTNPNLSVGRPGDVVTADKLNMSDEKLDDWVESGLGIEIDEAPVRSAKPAPKTEGATTTVTTVIGDAFEDVWDEDEDEDEYEV